MEEVAFPEEIVDELLLGFAYDSGNELLDVGIVDVVLEKVVAPGTLGSVGSDGNAGGVYVSVVEASVKICMLPANTGVGVVLLDTGLVS